MAFSLAAIHVVSNACHFVSEDRLTQTSAGVLVVTNQRIVLQPAPGNKPVSIPLAKVRSYNCYNNGVEVYKEGREKGYFFSVKDSGAVELFCICLEFLLGGGAELQDIILDIASVKTGARHFRQIEQTYYITSMIF